MIRTDCLQCLLASDTDVDEEALPFAHTCDSYTFRDVLDTNQLEPSPCQVYTGENLLYFFYGRPAYKKILGESVSMESFWPVTLLIDPISFGGIKRVLPFDSGGFPKQYEQALHPKMKREHFELAADIQTIRRFVKGFWGCNRAYFEGRKDGSPSIRATDFEAKAFVELISTKTSTPGDDRRSSIEIQIEDIVALRPGTPVVLAVLPSEISEEPEVATKLTEWGAEIRPYSIHHGDPSQATGLIYQEVRKFLEERDLFRN